jgi:hypothetical protein
VTTCQFPTTDSTDTGATPMTPSGLDAKPTVSRTVEYHRPARDSVNYTPNADLSLGMISGPSLASSPRIGQHFPLAPERGAPSAFKSPPILSPGFENVSNMFPTRAAPAPPNGSSSRDRDPGLPSTPQPYGSGAGSTSRGTYNGKSNQPSPNPNRYSSGASGVPGIPNGAPQRPSRSGTMPTGLPGTDYGLPSTSSGFRDPVPPPLSLRNPMNSSAPSPANPGSAFLNHPPPPPLTHQPFSAPGNPYQSLEQSMEGAKITNGAGQPMTVVEKELPSAPVTMGRNRSGTGKSTKDKKSVFGVLSGEYRCGSMLTIRIAYDE